MFKSQDFESYNYHWNLAIEKASSRVLSAYKASFRPFLTLLARLVAPLVASFIEFSRVVPTLLASVFAD
jgi:hypothetical protein